MVVWEDGRMKKSDYRKFIIRTVIGNDDFASMREVVTRRYTRLQQEKQPMPGLVLIDGGIGQLHAAADALEAIGIINQPLASIAKREEIIYVYGQEDEPVVLDRFSPILGRVQSIRDEAHRFTPSPSTARARNAQRPDFRSWTASQAWERRRCNGCSSTLGVRSWCAQPGRNSSPPWWDRRRRVRIMGRYYEEQLAAKEPA